MANVTVDLDREMIKVKNIGIPLDMFGLGDSNGSGYNLTFRIKDTYTNPDGKFS